METDIIRFNVVKESSAKAGVMIKGYMFVPFDHLIVSNSESLRGWMVISENCCALWMLGQCFDIRNSSQMNIPTI